jgi:hypothetical protein
MTFGRFPDLYVRALVGSSARTPTFHSPGMEDHMNRTVDAGRRTLEEAAGEAHCRREQPSELATKAAP